MADEIKAKPAARLGDPTVRGQLDQVGGLVLVKVIALYEPELHGCGGHPLLEVESVEAEAKTEKLDDVILTRGVARLRHERRIATVKVVVVSTRTAALSGLVVGGLVLAVAWLFELPADRVAVLAPVIVVIAAAVAGLGIFWIRAAADSIRDSKRPRLIVGLAGAVIVLGVVLTLLGIELPRE
jgi:hypothetical protein